LGENEVPDNILDDKEFHNKFLKTWTYTGSRCAWGFLGGMVLLMFMTENLYFENIMYPYAAKIAGLTAFVLAVACDAAYKHLKGIE